MTALEDYEKLRRVGEGTYATVYQARKIKTGEIVALKEIDLKKEEGIPSTALREIALLKELNHPNVLNLMNVIHSDERLVMVFEFVDGDLKRFLDYRKATQRPLSVSEIKGILKQLLRGLHYCHERNIMHRDLKPQNLLLDREGHLKLADFGLARGIGIPVSNYSTEVVTLWYRAPDILLGSSAYSTQIDLWSVGCIMGELYLLNPLFPGKNIQDQLLLIFKLLGTPTRMEWHQVLQTTHLQEAVHTLPQFPKPSDLNALFPMIEPTGQHLLARLLDYNPSRRITAHDALLHPFFLETSN